MRPELNREYPPPGEPELIEEMARVAARRMQPRKGRLRRGQHAKGTACVRGVFAVRDDVPDDLRYGVFRQPGRSFEAIVRFSNSSETIDPDGKGTARGIAVKLLGVDGTPALTGRAGQDFLAVNNPVFPFATPAEYLKFFKKREFPLVGELLAVAWLALFHRRHFKIIKAIRGLSIGSPLELTYYSGSPYWLGPPEGAGGRAVKFLFVPRSAGTAPPSDPSKMPEDYLTQAVGRHLRDRETVFDFLVQPQTDPVAMPVEDVSIRWDEGLSRPIPVATLTIGVQDIDSPDGQALAAEGEEMFFSPWNALAEHRPMGGINRLRRAVYAASRAKRGAKGSP